MASDRTPEVPALLETRDSAVVDDAQVVVQPALSFGSSSNSGSNYEYDESGWRR